MKNQLPDPLASLLDNPSDKKAYDEYFRSGPCKSIRDLIVQYLSDRIKLSTERSDSEVNYDKPAWSEFQADHSGRRKAYRELINLLDR